MKLPKAELERLCGAVDFTDKRFDCVYLDVENKRVISTDARALIRRSVEVEQYEVSGVIAREVLEYARSVNADIIERRAESIVVRRTRKPSGIVETLATFEHEQDGEFPPLDACDSFFENFTKTPFAVINVALLVKVCEAFKRRTNDDECEDDMQCCVALYARENAEFANDGATCSILVAPIQDHNYSDNQVDCGCLGVIMPMSVEPEQFDKLISRGAKKASAE